MLNHTPQDRAHYVNRTFSRIARHYDLMNRLMTGGMDIRWRKEVIHLADLSAGSKLLDLGTGTGDLARAALQHTPSSEITAADFTLEMMTAGNRWTGIQRCTADALNLPFENNAFDVIISGFLMRNVSSVAKALGEQYRVLKPGSRIIILDTTRPRPNILSPLIRIYLSYVIPFLGNLITSEKEAYTYLPESTRNFLKAEDLASALKDVGFAKVSFRIRMFGTIAIHTAVKP